MAVTRTHISTLTALAPGQIKVKHLNKPPNYGVVLIRGKEVANGFDSVIQLQMYPEYSSTGSGRPVLAVLPSEEYWFLFEQDIMKAWENSK
jgi:hypothetical protein